MLAKACALALIGSAAAFSPSVSAGRKNYNVP
jgi:hypothetical protein